MMGRDKKNQLRKFYYLIPFIEGGVLMGVELAGVKLVAPIYGSSLYVWGAMLFVTLLALTMGYFLGGVLAKKTDVSKSISLAISITTILILIMPSSASFLIEVTSTSPFYIGPVLSPLGFLLPPVVLMGMISPLVIQLGENEEEKFGEKAGSVYAVSTFGGIVVTLFIGLYFLPEFGAESTVLLLALALGFLAVLTNMVLKSYKTISLLVVICVSLYFVEYRIEGKQSSSSTQLYKSDGILGEIKVVDYPYQGEFISRFLMINGVPETNTIVEYNALSVWPYVHRIAALASIKPEGSKALLIGMAGGTLAMELSNLGMQVDIVEIDARMPKIAKEYFDFNETDKSVYIDDGRHFINSSTNTYDLIILDALDGENQPFHLYTKEAFEQMKRILSPTGMILMNYQGTIDGKDGIAPRSILKTLEATGFEINYYLPKKRDEQNNRSGDLVFIATNSKLNIQKPQDLRVNQCCSSFGFVPSEILSKKSLDLNPSFVLKDDQPLLEKLNMSWTMKWRKRMIAKMYLQKAVE